MGKRLCEVSNMCIRSKCNKRAASRKCESPITYVKADRQATQRGNQIHVIQNGSKAITFCTDQAELKFCFKSKGNLGFCTVEKPGRGHRPMLVCINSDGCNKKIIHAKFNAAGDSVSHGKKKAAISMCPGENNICYELHAPDDQNLNINLNTQDQVCPPQHCTNVKLCTGKTGMEMNLNMHCMDGVNPKIELPAGERMLNSNYGKHTITSLIATRMTAMKMEILKNAKFNAPPPPFITT